MPKKLDRQAVLDIRKQYEVGYEIHELAVASLRSGPVGGKVNQRIDIPISHPRLVQSGPDLMDLSAVVWFDTDDSVNSCRRCRASVMSHRAGSTERCSP